MDISIIITEENKKNYPRFFNFQKMKERLRIYNFFLIQY